MVYVAVITAAAVMVSDRRNRTFRVSQLCLRGWPGSVEVLLLVSWAIGGNEFRPKWPQALVSRVW